MVYYLQCCSIASDHTQTVLENPVSTLQDHLAKVDNPPKHALPPFVHPALKPRINVQLYLELDLHLPVFDHASIYALHVRAYSAHVYT